MKTAFWVVLVCLAAMYSCSEDEGISAVSPEAGFKASSTNVSEGVAVVFTDTTVNEPESWSWDFGDGGTSTEQNPSHTYSKTGIYTVALTATNSAGSDTETKTSYMSVNEVISDYDGNTYKTVTIGSQHWMAENLKTKHYADGTSIPNVTDETAWKGLTVENKAWCYYDNTTTNGDKYGALYTWAAAVNSPTPSTGTVQGACPNGWHIASESEWDKLETYIKNDGLEDKEAEALRSTTGWYEVMGLKMNGTDNYGFNGISSGNRYSDGTFDNLGDNLDIWLDAETSSKEADAMCLGCADHMYPVDRVKQSGRSVRCIKD